MGCAEERPMHVGSPCGIIAFPNKALALSFLRARSAVQMPVKAGAKVSDSLGSNASSSICQAEDLGQVT